MYTTTTTTHRYTIDRCRHWCCWNCGQFYANYCRSMLTNYVYNLHNLIDHTSELEPSVTFSSSEAYQIHSKWHIKKCIPKGNVRSVYAYARMDYAYAHALHVTFQHSYLFDLCRNFIIYTSISCIQLNCAFSNVCINLYIGKRKKAVEFYVIISTFWAWKFGEYKYKSMGKKPPSSHWLNIYCCWIFQFCFVIRWMMKTF